MQNNLETATQSINAIQNLSDTVFSIRLNKAKKGSAEEEKIARKQFDVNKALQIASATMNGIQSVLAITASAVDPTGITTAIRIGAQAVLTAASVAKIASTRFDSSGGGASSSVPSGGALGGGGGAAPSFNIVGNSTANQLAQVETKPVQAFVVSGEVTSAQALDRNRQTNATFG